jgi:DNA-binding FadR family transcriptional regulator
MTIPSAPGFGARRGLHRVVVDDLGLRVVRGDLGSGATFPTEADLSTRLGVLTWQVEAGPGPVASMRLDLALHAAILRATHKGLLAAMTRAVIAALGAGPVSAFRASAGPESTNRAHRLVVEAIGRNP